jgi:hypothetical protein
VRLIAVGKAMVFASFRAAALVTLHNRFEYALDRQACVFLAGAKSGTSSLERPAAEAPARESPEPGNSA